MTDTDALDAPKMRLARVRSDLLDRGIDAPLDKWRANDGVLNVADRSPDVDDAVREAAADHDLRVVTKALKKPTNGGPFARYILEDAGGADV